MITPKGEGEVINVIGDRVSVKLDSGATLDFLFDDNTSNNSAGYASAP